MYLAAEMGSEKPKCVLGGLPSLMAASIRAAREVVNDLTALVTAQVAKDALQTAVPQTSPQTFPIVPHTAPAGSQTVH